MYLQAREFPPLLGGDGGFWTWAVLVLIVAGLLFFGRFIYRELSKEPE